MNEQGKTDTRDTVAGLTAGQKLQLKMMFLAVRGLRLLGHDAVNSLAAACALCFWHLAASRRRYTITAVEKHLNLSRAEAKTIARASFRHNFQSFFDLVFAEGFGLHDNPRLVHIPPDFERMASEKRPIVGISGHLGAWELLAGAQARIGVVSPEASSDASSDADRATAQKAAMNKETTKTADRTAAAPKGTASNPNGSRPSVLVVRYPQGKAMRVFMRLMRTHGNCRSVGHRNAAGEVTSVLRQNGLASFLADHNTNRHEAIFLPFLGEVAAVNQGPALLALRGKALVYPLYLKRLPGNRYEFRTLPPLDTTLLTGSISERTLQIAEFYTKALEQFVKETPEQWFWMHKRWKTRPQ